MAIKYKIPSQASSGAETFSDALVGLQITNGSNQLTNSNFAIDRTIPEKDSKSFVIEPFSSFMTLSDIKEEVYTGVTNSVYTKQNKNDKIKFKKSNNNGNVSLFGSLKERIGVTVTNIIKKYPAAVYVDKTTPARVNNYTAQNIEYDSLTNITDFKIQFSILYNPLELVFKKPKSNIIPVSSNDIRNFFSSYTNYVIDINGDQYKITYYEEPDSNNLITLSVEGNCFSGLTTYDVNFLIKPNNGYIEEFYSSLDELECVLLNRDTNPKFTASFNIINDENEQSIEEVTWPISLDGWNIKLNGLEYDRYISKLSEIGDEIDGYKSNLINRFLVSPQIFEFDTDDKKISSIFQIYGQSFDNVKTYIDNIANMRNITYDGINNIPDILLKSYAETLGISTTNMFNSKTLEESIYYRGKSNYDGISNGLNLVETEYEFYRRLLNNISYLYKSKGTRKSIEFLLKFIGAPSPMIVFNEYVYKVSNPLSSIDVNNDISKVISGENIKYIGVYNVNDSSTMISGITDYVSLYREEFPVDETTLLPRKITSNDGSIYFEMGAGWRKNTLNHRSSDILDVKNSNLNNRIKVIKTMSKPFTYGEEYFDHFRKLPGLNYGYDLVSFVDNKKTHVVESLDENEEILNRKNIEVFLSPSRMIDFAIYRKVQYREISDDYISTSDNFELITSQDDEDLMYTNEGTLGKTVYEYSFDEYVENIMNIYASELDTIKYEKTYYSLHIAYYNYMKSTAFKPYTFGLVNNYINVLSPNWVDIIEQFVPASTLWMGGNLIENSVYCRPKYQHLENRTTNKTNYFYNL